MSNFRESSLVQKFYFLLILFLSFIFFSYSLSHTHSFRYLTVINACFLFFYLVCKGMQLIIYMLDFLQMVQMKQKNQLKQEHNLKAKQYFPLCIVSLAWLLDPQSDLMWLRSYRMSQACRS